MIKSLCANFCIRPGFPLTQRGFKKVSVPMFCTFATRLPNGTNKEVLKLSMCPFLHICYQTCELHKEVFKKLEWLTRRIQPSLYFAKVRLLNITEVPPAQNRTENLAWRLIICLTPSEHRGNKIYTFFSWIAVDNPIVISVR